MAKKRKYHTSLETQSCDPKRQRSSLDPQSAYLSIPHPDISNHPLRARVEQPSTQRTAIPGLDDDNEADLNHETSVEALAYLRSVRYGTNPIHLYNLQDRKKLNLFPLAYSCS